MRDRGRGVVGSGREVVRRSAVAHEMRSYKGTAAGYHQRHGDSSTPRNPSCGVHA